MHLLIEYPQSFGESIIGRLRRFWGLCLNKLSVPLASVTWWNGWILICTCHLFSKYVLSATFFQTAHKVTQQIFHHYRPGFWVKTEVWLILFRYGKPLNL